MKATSKALSVRASSISSRRRSRRRRLELLQEQQYRRNFTFKRCYPEISVSVLLGEGDEQMLYTVDIACDGTVQVNETRGTLIGGEEAAAKLIAALLPYLSAASEPIDR